MIGCLIVITMGTLLQRIPDTIPVAKTTRNFVARQPILDRQQRLFAYELLFRSSENNLFDGTEQTSATCRTIDSWLLIGPNSLTEGRRAFVNCTREVLLGEMVTILPRDLCVLEILEDVEPDRELLDRCRWLRRNGYLLALDDFTAHHQLSALVEVADIIKVDFQHTTCAEQVEFARHARHGIAMLAEKVENAEQFELAKKLGYSYFQGFFFAKPSVLSTCDISLLQTTCIRLLQKTVGPEYDPRDVEEIIKQEPSLCYRLLRYLNSAAFGLYPIRSIGHALAIMGQRELQKWIALVSAVQMGTQGSTALVSMALVRARFCELLAEDLHTPEGDYFLVGLLSLMDAILNQPRSMVLAQLPISQGCRAALAAEDNELGKVLQLSIASERGEWETLTRECSALNIPEGTAWARYTEAIQWANLFTSEQ